MTLTYPYRPKPWLMLSIVLFFGVIAFFMGQEAITNERGLTINRIFELSPRGATIFYWCMAAGAGAFVLFATMLFIIGLLSKQRITLTERALSVPKNGFSRETTTIPVSDISSTDMQTVQKQRFLNVYHPRGKLTIIASQLPAGAFEELVSALAHLSSGSIVPNNRVQTTRSKQRAPDA